MSDMTAMAASQMESMSTRAATTGAKQGVRATVALSAGSARVSANVAHRAAGGTVRGLVALVEAARFTSSKNADSGRVGLKQFTKITNGRREILPISEKEVAGEFVRELRKHGVTFAIEKHRDGSRTFHVEGKDAAVVEHALSQASIRVDDRIQRETDRREPKQGEGEQEKQPAVEGSDLSEDIAATEVQHAAEPDGLSLSEPGTRDLPGDDDLSAPEVILVLDRRERSALVQVLHGAPHRETLADQVQNQGQITLNRENVAILNTVSSEQGWTQDSQEMGWVAGAVAKEYERLAPPTAENPWLNVEPEQGVEISQTEDAGRGNATEVDMPERVKTGADSPDSRAEAAGEKTHEGRGPQTAAAGERQLSPLDATREKVAKQIDNKAQVIKAERGVGQAKNRATPRSPKVKR